MHCYCQMVQVTGHKAMLSPATQHRLNAKLRNGLCKHALYESVLMGQFEAGLNKMKHIKSRKLRMAAKRNALSRYQGWLDDFMQSPRLSGFPTEMFVWLLLWHIDVNDWQRALELARFALQAGFCAPKDFSRTLAETVCEEIAEGLLKTGDLTQYADVLTELRAVVSAHDMTDQITAKLYKASGLAKLTSQPEQAREDFLKALDLDDEAGVKRYLKALDTPQKAKGTPVNIQDYSLSARAAAQLANMTAPAFLRHAKKWPDKLPYIAIPVGQRTLYRFNPIHVKAYLRQRFVNHQQDTNHVQS